MRRLFREEYEQQKKTCIGLDKARREVNEELDRLLAENDQRNRDLAAARYRNQWTKFQFFRAEREKETYAKLEEETLRDIERRLEKESLSVEKKAKEVQEMIVSEINLIIKNTKNSGP